MGQPSPRTSVRDAVSKLEGCCDTLSYLWVDVIARRITGRGEITEMPRYSSETIAFMIEAIQRHCRPAIHRMDVFAEMTVG